MKFKQTALVAALVLFAAPAFADREEDIDFMITCVTAKMNGINNLIDLQRVENPELLAAIEFLKEDPFMRGLVGRIVDDPSNIEETSYPQYRPLIRQCMFQLNTI